MSFHLGSQLFGIIYGDGPLGGAGFVPRRQPMSPVKIHSIYNSKGLTTRQANNPEFRIGTQKFRCSAIELVVQRVGSSDLERFATSKYKVPGFVLYVSTVTAYYRSIVSLVVFDIIKYSL